jgi:hypothetical protein
MRKGVIFAIAVTYPLCSLTAARVASSVARLIYLLFQCDATIDHQQEPSPLRPVNMQRREVVSSTRCCLPDTKKMQPKKNDASGWIAQ